MQTTVTIKGQVTIPKPIRDRLGIRPSDRVEVTEEDGRVVMRPVRTLLDLRGAVTARRQGDHWDGDDERQAAKRAVADRVREEMAEGEE